MTFKNNTIIAGNLVKDMEIIETNSLMSDGSPFKIGKGTLAINQSKDEADFISFEVTGWVVKRILDANKHLKGSNLGVSGVLVDDTYEKDGKTRHNIKVKGDDVMFGDHFMGSWNQVTLYAHVAQNPESKQSANGTVYTRFNIANAVYDMRKKESVSSFFRAVAFGAKAEFIKDYFKKGDALMVQGRLSTSKAESSQPDGTPITYYNTELIVENIRFAQRKADGAQKSQGSEQLPNQNQNQNVQPNQNSYNMSGFKKELIALQRKYELMDSVELLNNIVADIERFYHSFHRIKDGNLASENWEVLQLLIDSAHVINHVIKMIERKRTDYRYLKDKGMEEQYLDDLDDEM